MNSAVSITLSLGYTILAYLNFYQVINTVTMRGYVCCHVAKNLTGNVNLCLGRALKIYCVNIIPQLNH